MEDANLNEAVDEHTEEEDVHYDQARWWFASAALPMIAGTLGPMASAFSICALVKPWRQHLVPGSDVTQATFIADPPWLLAINAVQLAIAVISNLSLLLNMAKRVSFSIAQPITIVGWYISSFLLVGLCATATGPLLVQPEKEYVWSQAFYYGLFAAVLYFVVASLMVINVWGARTGHYPHDFELTMSQRTLMLQTILFLMYLLIGALVFSTIEGWLYLDAVYWADITLFTVGLGDVSLQTKLGRGLMIPYTLIGITTLGLVIGSIRSLMLDRGKSRLDARMLEKKRRRFVQRLQRSSKGQILEPIIEEEPEDPLGPDTASGLQKSTQAELERRHKEFHLMRRIQDKASKRRRWTALGISTSTWVVLWLVGAKVFQICEAPYQNWSYFDGVYFSFQAMVTVGYGDLTPVSNPSKAFFVFWSLLALPTLTILISNAGDTIIKGIRDATVLLGNITILPGEQGYHTDIKQFLSKLSFGVLFSEANIQESPPGFLGVAPPRPDDSDEDADDSKGSQSSPREGHEGQAEKFHPKTGDYGRGLLGKAKEANQRRSESNDNDTGRDKTKQQSGESNEQGIPDELPRTRSEYHLVLIDEIRRVSQHLQHSPARQYTYREWAWYLRLIGEDESDASTHRTPAKKRQSIDDEKAPQAAGQWGGERSAASGERHEQQENRPKWSWVGHRSPLMDPRDEAMWILDRLSQRLRQELLTAAAEKRADDDEEAEADDREGNARDLRGGPRRRDSGDARV